MPIHHELWTVESEPKEIQRGQLPSERMLKEMILSEPRMLSGDWMLIGSEVQTGANGRIDLLAIAPDSSLVVIELKRDRTPREVVAQALDYARQVELMDADRIMEIYSKFRQGRTLAADFLERFGQPLDEANLNADHQIVVVAASLDAATERIIQYLNGRGVSINVLFFQVFQLGEQQLLGRAWLIDPADVQAPPISRTTGGAEKEPWNKEYYLSFGAGASRSWEEAVKYGFVSGGGGSWYSSTLAMLKPGDRFWAKIPGKGFVGVGRAIGERTPASEFQIEGRPALDVLKAGYHREFSLDPEACEYFVPVKWEKTLLEADAVQEPGMFGNQNTVCRPSTPSWRTTVDRLRQHFGVDD